MELKKAKPIVSDFLAREHLTRQQLYCLPS